MAVIGIGVMWIVAGCSQPADGVGYAQVSDLSDAQMATHFTAAPERIKARLGVTPSGCVTIRMDGVEHVPLWPEGTRVTEDRAEPGAYVVELPGGSTLRTGERVEALGVVDDSALSFDDEDAPVSKVGGVIDFCAPEAVPVAFFDATAIKPLVD